MLVLIWAADVHYLQITMASPPADYLNHPFSANPSHYQAQLLCGYVGSTVMCMCVCLCLLCIVSGAGKCQDCGHFPTTAVVRPGYWGLNQCSCPSLVLIFLKYTWAPVSHHYYSQTLLGLIPPPLCPSCQQPHVNLRDVGQCRICQALAQSPAR